MSRCLVRNCKNSSRKRTRCELFSFPHEPETCNKWIKVTGDNKLDTKTARICSIHCESSTYTKDCRNENHGSNVMIKTDEPVRFPLEVVVCDEEYNDPITAKENDPLADVSAHLADISRLQKELETKDTMLREQKQYIEQQEEKLRDLQNKLDASEAECRRQKKNELELKISQPGMRIPGQIKQMTNEELCQVKWSSVRIFRLR